MPSRTPIMDFRVLFSVLLIYFFTIKYQLYSSDKAVQLYVSIILTVVNLIGIYLINKRRIRIIWHLCRAIVRAVMSLTPRLLTWRWPLAAALWLSQPRRKPAAHRCCLLAIDRRDRQTDRQADTVPLHRRSPLEADVVNKLTSWNFADADPSTERRSGVCGVRAPASGGGIMWWHCGNYVAAPRHNIRRRDVTAAGRAVIAALSARTLSPGDPAMRPAAPRANC